MKRLRRLLSAVGLLPPCQHHWRPARNNGCPARWCALCDRLDDLTEEDFYAQFGRMSHDCEAMRRMGVW